MDTQALRGLKLALDVTGGAGILSDLHAGQYRGGLKREISFFSSSLIFSAMGLPSNNLANFDLRFQPDLFYAFGFLRQFLFHGAA
jgi:hypothetical protein